MFNTISNTLRKTAFVKDFLKKVMDHLDIYKLPDPAEAARDLSGISARPFNEIYVSLTDDILNSITPENKCAFNKKLLSSFLSVMNSASKRFHKDLKNLSKEDIKKEIALLTGPFRRADAYGDHSTFQYINGKLIMTTKWGKTFLIQESSPNWNKLQVNIKNEKIEPHESGEGLKKCDKDEVEDIEEFILNQPPNKKLGFKGNLDDESSLMNVEGLQRAIKDRDGKVFTAPMLSGHKKILVQIAREKPAEEEFLRNELFKDRAGKYSPHIGFVNNKGEYLSREETEKLMKEEIEKPKSYAQLFHYSSVSDNIRRIAENILDPDIKNPLPEIKKEAESIYQEFIASKDGKEIYERTNKVEEILNSIRPKISEASKNDPDKFQLLNAYLRDKISEGLR